MRDEEGCGVGPSKSLATVGQLPAVRRESAVVVGTAAVGALALGAVAMSALTIGRMAIGHLLLGRTRMCKEEVDDFVIARLTIRELRIERQR